MIVDNRRQINEKIEVYKAVLLMPEITNDIKEVYSAKIQSLESELKNYITFE